MTDAGSNVERLLLWETAWNMLRERPLLGVGVGNYRDAQDSYLRSEVPAEVTRTHVHNIWLQAAVERGALGLLALLWVAAAVLAETLRALRRAAGGERLPRALSA